MPDEALDKAELRNASVRFAAGVIGLMRLAGYADAEIATRFGLGSGLDDEARMVLRDAFAWADMHGEGLTDG